MFKLEDIDESVDIEGNYIWVSKILTNLFIPVLENDVYNYNNTYRYPYLIDKDDVKSLYYRPKNETADIQYKEIINKFPNLKKHLNLTGYLYTDFNENKVRGNLRDLRTERLKFKKMKQEETQAEEVRKQSEEVRKLQEQLKDFSFSININNDNSIKNNSVTNDNSTHNIQNTDNSTKHIDQSVHNIDNSIHNNILVYDPKIHNLHLQLIIGDLYMKDPNYPIQRFLEEIKSKIVPELQKILKVQNCVTYFQGKEKPYEIYNEDGTQIRCDGNYFQNKTYKTVDGYSDLYGWFNNDLLILNLCGDKMSLIKSEIEESNKKSIELPEKITENVNNKILSRNHCELALRFNELLSRYRDSCRSKNHPLSAINMKTLYATIKNIPADFEHLENIVGKIGAGNLKQFTTRVFNFINTYVTHYNYIKPDHNYMRDTDTGVLLFFK